MLCLFLKLIRKIGHIGVDDRCSEMFMGIILVSPHETITRPLGVLRFVSRAKCHCESYESRDS